MRIARAWIDPFECDDWQHDDDTEASGLWFHDGPDDDDTQEVEVPIYWPTEDDGEQD
jgi:hypothetical protein